MVQDLTRLRVGDPEGETVSSNLVSDGTVGKVSATQIIEAEIWLAQVFR
jgi:phosphoribosylformylglycinamidine (FGAM) synthase PurS component